jgi:hypothetical protein
VVKHRSTGKTGGHRLAHECTTPMTVLVPGLHLGANRSQTGPEWQMRRAWSQLNTRKTHAIGQKHGRDEGGCAASRLSPVPGRTASDASRTGSTSALRRTGKCPRVCRPGLCQRTCGLLCGHPDNRPTIGRPRLSRLSQAGPSAGWRGVPTDLSSLLSGSLPRYRAVSLCG